MTAPLETATPFGIAQLDFKGLVTNLSESYSHKSRRMNNLMKLHIMLMV